MAQPYVGEIRIFAGNFAPAGWMFCEGQLLPISGNETLFQLIGTTYGGDGQATFGLPDLQGRMPIHVGQGPGITQNYQLGEKAGTESVTLTTQQLPTHKEAERALEDEAMRRANHNQGIAADLIGMTRAALNRRLIKRRSSDRRHNPDSPGRSSVQRSASGRKAGDRRRA